MNDRQKNEEMEYESDFEPDLGEIGEKGGETSSEWEEGEKKEEQESDENYRETPVI